MPTTIEVNKQSVEALLGSGRGWAKTLFKIKPHSDSSLEYNQAERNTVWFLNS